jgi:DNA mismatch repair ATPase MutS
VHGIQKWRRRYGHCIDQWLDTVGEFEAVLSLASHAREHPRDPFPELVEPGPLFEGSQLAHPLLPESTAVRNDVSLSAATPLIMVSGSNMSGKSTLLRTVGTNAVLALAGAPVRAQRLRLSSLQVGSAMRVHDSLQDGKSLFYANLTRLRAIVALAGKTPPLLFLLDEILQGTNSHDRRIGAEAVIRKLLDGGAIGLVTTHDLELTRIVESLDGRAVNVHFADQLVDGKMTFDYRIHPGVVERSNALELMRMMGLDV